ncbi:hypothetical protein AVEN_197953-1 [Araneus ventricosus]|uniref:Uncharacterized protein n=1 Tax=Araneus ventricosus TaxID=182803 RepID=A0A4Y2MBL2_ARAVE|nr:hypothetical protein AVEN_197953-1 [Araneus ventricosus]
MTNFQAIRGFNNIYPFSDPTILDGISDVRVRRCFSILCPSVHILPATEPAKRGGHSALRCEDNLQDALIKCDNAQWSLISLGRWTEPSIIAPRH